VHHYGPEPGLACREKRYGSGPDQAEPGRFGDRDVRQQKASWVPCSLLADRHSPETIPPKRTAVPRRVAWGVVLLDVECSAFRSEGGISTNIAERRSRCLSPSMCTAHPQPGRVG
jgi:hypothetical protein